MTRLAALALTLSACTTDSDVDTAPPPADPVIMHFSNFGDNSMEGHTPRGFQGEGTGMFIGDDLNPSFPSGDGVQLFLTMDLDKAKGGAPFIDGSAWQVSSAQLTSDNLQTAGTPFTDLGVLTAEEIEFDAFSSELWDAKPVKGGFSCQIATSETDFGCDLTELVQKNVDASRPYVQLRVRFDTPGDSDGAQDMVLFFKTDSNSTERGLFDLEVEAVPL